MHHLAMHFVRHLQIAPGVVEPVVPDVDFRHAFFLRFAGAFSAQSRAAQEIYFANMFVAAALLAAQWLVAKKKKLINEDEPLKTQPDGTADHFLSCGAGRGPGGRSLHQSAGRFYAMAIVLLALRAVAEDMAPQHDC